MRRLLIAFYVFLCIGLFVLLLAAIYVALPTTTEWTLDEASLDTLSHQQLKNDFWQWRPSPDRELLAMARTEYVTQKIVLPKLVRRTWGYHTYYKFRLTNQQVADQLWLATQSEGVDARAYLRQRAEEPLPSWWHPTHVITLRRDGQAETFYIDPAERGIAYSIGAGHEGTLSEP